MKTFKMDAEGDVVIKDNVIEMVSDIELVKQTLRQVLGTNLKEWGLDETEGIDFSVILIKNPNNDLIRDTIETAVNKVATQLNVDLETDNYNFAVTGRNMNISLDIKLNGGDSETVSLTF